MTIKNSDGGALAGRTVEAGVRIRSTLRAATVLAASLVLAAPALADGGNGGALGAPTPGGADSATGTGDAGQPGNEFSRGAGGGGGAGVTGGAGGAGAGGLAGGLGGASAGAGGGVGADTMDNLNSSGGGGGGGAHGAVVSTSGALAGSIGGNGGNGGRGPTESLIGAGGGGGAGGYGAVVTGSGLALGNSGAVAGGRGGDGGHGGGESVGSGGGPGGDGGSGGIGLDVLGTSNSLVNSATIRGGTGGAGGSATPQGQLGFAGNGGDGGAGVAGSGLTITNTGAINGGDGGAGGVATPGNGAKGAGGVGIIGANLSIINGGAIAGGLAGDGATRANAVTFTGGVNTIELQAGYAVDGNVAAFSSADTLRLGGTAPSATFDASAIGSQYLGFGHFEKTGTGSWTLTNTTAAVTPWTITAGTLSVGSDGALGAAAGTLTLNGGTLQTTQGFNSTRTIVLASASAIDVSTGTFGIAGQITGSGALTKLGTGTLTLSGTTNNYTGDTLVNAGTLAGGVANAFSAASATTINAGGTVDLGGFAQTINTLALNGGTLTNGSLTSAGGIVSQGGSVANVGGSTGLIASSGITALTGTNTYTGATTVDGITTAGNANAYSKTSVTTVNTFAIFGLGGFAHSIDTVLLNGGTLADGALAGSVTSSGGTMASLGGTATVTTTAGTTTLTRVTTANTYNGATTVNGGTLLGSAANAFSAASATTINAGGTVDLGGFAQTINAVALAGGTLINGSLTGAVTSNGGTLTNLGGAMTLAVNGGTTNLTGTNSFTGQTTVNGGVLSVNGSSTSAVTVNAGGTLGGNGTVGSTTINGGALAPGNSIGLLTVQGNLVFTTASSYMVEVSPVNADRTNVTGTATLGGATVNATFAPGSYVSKQYTIINAGSVNGTFSSLVNSNLPSGFTPSLSYDAGNAYLNLTLNLTPSGPSFGNGLPGNQQAVGNALVNFFNTTGGIPMVYGTLTPAGLTQASGESATGSQQTTFNAMDLFLGLLTDPFVAGRDGGFGGSAAAVPFAEESAALAYAARKTDTRDALAAIYTKAPPRQLAFEQRWSVWAAGYGGSQTTSGNAVLGSNNSTSSVYGTAVGADYRFSPNTLAGFAIAGGGTNFSVNGLGWGRSDLFQAGVFARHNIGPAYLSAALAYGWQDVTTDRIVTAAGVDHLRAQFNANAWSGRFEGGYRYATPWIGLTPYAAAQFTTFELPNYAESVVSGNGAFALNYAARSVTDTRSELGLRSDKSFAVEGGVVTLRGRVAWAHDFNPDRSVAAVFQALPGAAFVVNGAAQARDSALTTASAEVRWRSGWAVAATFEGEFSDITQSYAGKGVVRYAW